LDRGALVLEQLVRRRQQSSAEIIEQNWGMEWWSGGVLDCGLLE
jgi:hypothetical protein